MHPILFYLGSRPIHTFGPLMALGFLAGWLLMRRLTRGTARTADDLSTLLAWLMFGGLAGGRMAYVIEHWQAEFAAHPAAIIRVDQGGLMFYGGLAGGLIALLLFAWRRREPLLEWCDLTAVALPLGHALGRLGCFMNGCCHGRPWKGALAVRFPAQAPAWQEQVLAGQLSATATRSLPVLPIQLIEAAANLLLCALLYRLARRRPRAGRVTACYLLGYAGIRFATEFGRGDARLNVGALSIGQLVSLALLAAGVALLVARRGKRLTFNA
jgi:phosphatidylglycerol:prolipoprotein diacylglycerol transferase